MSALPSAVQTSNGRILHLTNEIGRGGEGAIYETREQDDIAIKIYLSNKAQSRRDKVSAMAAAQWYKNNPFVAFPIDVLFSPSGAFVGFAMKKISGHKPVHMLYRPASRKQQFQRANFQFLIRTATNIARAVASVHKTACVIGDVNHSGFLVSEKATSVLIDSDSFQVVAGNNNFLCQVGTPEYTPPELQGTRFDRTRRIPNHDNFGLAILVFQLLFMGRHPFSGKFLGSGEMPLERAISEYRFAYSAQASVNKMERPPGTPMLSDFPSYMGQAFESAFGRSGPQARPKASEWVSLLEQLEKELQKCAADPNHQHVKGNPCPWCRMEQAYPGFVAFSSTLQSVFIPTTIDIRQISAIINAIRDPGPTPALQSFVTTSSALSAATPSNALISRLKKRAFGGIAASGLGAVLIFFGGDAVVPGAIVLGSGLLCNVVIPPELKQLRQARSTASTSWRNLENTWSQQAGNQRYLEIKRETIECIQKLADLPNEERYGLQALEQKKREAQLYRHLDQFLIANAKVKKVGSSRKAILASYGIETAADIDSRKIESIQGFGPLLVAELVAWRRLQERKFVFNPAEPLNPADLSVLKNKITRAKTEIENKIRTSAANLEFASKSCFEQRNKLAAAANQTWATLKQSELNESAVAGPIHKSSKIVSLCCAGLALYSLTIGNAPVTRAPNTNRSVVVNSPPAQPAIPPRPNIVLPKPSAPPPSQSPVQIPSGPQVQQRAPNLTQTSQAELSTSEPAPLEVPREIPNIPKPSTPPASPPALDLARSEDATRIQQRLIDLGYLAGVADGKWGPRSKGALVEFKSRANLLGTDVWDDAVQSALFSNAATRNSPDLSSQSLAFVGGWTTEVGACGNPGEVAPLRISANRAESDGGACDFKSIRPDGQNAWKIAAVCSSGGQSHQANVRLSLRGSELSWISEKPETMYYRCPD